jgi:adenine-specific DNA glycosylase
VTDVFANLDYGTFEFHDVTLKVERPHEFIYCMMFEGSHVCTSTPPNPTEEELIDALLRAGKAHRYARSVNDD